MIIYVGVKA